MIQRVHTIVLLGCLYTLVAYQHLGQNPAVTYLDDHLFLAFNSPYGLKTARCKDFECTTITADCETSLLDNAVARQYRSDMPLIIYANRDSNLGASLISMACNNPSCSSHSLSTLASNDAGYDIRITSPTPSLIIEDATALVFYVKTSSSTLVLNIAFCITPACSQATFYDLGDQGMIANSMGSLSVARGPSPDYAPMISHHAVVDGSGVVMLTTCRGLNTCKYYNQTKVGRASEFSSMVFPSKSSIFPDFPIITYVSEDYRSINAAFCEDLMCMNHQIMTLFPLGSQGLGFLSAMISAAGYLLVTFFANDRLLSLVCTEHLCADSPMPQVIDQGNSAWLTTNMKIMTVEGGGYRRCKNDEHPERRFDCPVLIYNLVTQYESVLKIVYCQDSSCKSSRIRVIDDNQADNEQHLSLSFDDKIFLSISIPTMLIAIAGSVKACRSNTMVKDVRTPFLSNVMIDSRFIKAIQYITGVAILGVVTSAFPWFLYFGWDLDRYSYWLLVTPNFLPILSTAAGYVGMIKSNRIALGLATFLGFVTLGSLALVSCLVIGLWERPCNTSSITIVAVPSLVGLTTGIFVQLFLIYYTCRVFRVIWLSLPHTEETTLRFEQDWDSFQPRDRKLSTSFPHRKHSSFSKRNAPDQHLLRNVAEDGE